VSEDACEQARSFETDDQSPAAQHARRACRLQRFGDRLAAERRQEIAAAEQSQAEWVQAWTEATQPARVSRPFTAAGFVGSGLASYGLAVSWAVLARLELEAWIGQRSVGSSDALSSRGTAVYTRDAAGLNARWLFSDKNVSPFVGAGFATTRADVQVVSYNLGPQLDLPAGTGNPSLGPGMFSGSARAHAVSASAGLQLAIRSVRANLEYVFTYAFYTGANDGDAQKTPDENMRLLWQDGIRSDRHGIRFQVGYAF
jgi:hypothetical protein